MMKDLRICSNLPLLQLQNRLLNSWERFFQLISDLLGRFAFSVCCRSSSATSQV